MFNTADKLVLPGPSLLYIKIMLATCVILDILVATLKNYKEISEIDFTNILYLTQYILILSSQHASNIKI